MHEWFVFPARFGFFTLTGLSKALASIQGTEAEIVILLDRPLGALAEQIGVADFALYCTPIINLFPRTVGPLKIDSAAHVHVLTPVSDAPRDYEVHSVQALRGQAKPDAPPIAFHDYHDAYRDDRLRDERYFALRRVLISPYAFGLVLERFVARHVSTHSYTTTALESLQRGPITQWAPRPGTRGVA